MQCTRLRQSVISFESKHLICTYLSQSRYYSYISSDKLSIVICQDKNVKKARYARRQDRKAKNALLPRKTKKEQKVVDNEVDEDVEKKVEEDVQVLNLMRWQPLTKKDYLEAKKKAQEARKTDNETTKKDNEKEVEGDTEKKVDKVDMEVPEVVPKYIASGKVFIFLNVILILGHLHNNNSMFRSCWPMPARLKS